MRIVVNGFNGLGQAPEVTERSHSRRSGIALPWGEVVALVIFAKLSQYFGSAPAVADAFPAVAMFPARPRPQDDEF